MDADGKPVLQCPMDWKGLPLERLTIPTSGECGPQFSGEPVVFASHFAGPGHRWYRCNGKTQEIPLVAGGMDLLGSTYERDHERWECVPGGETICLRLHTSIVERYLHEDAYHFDLKTQYCHKDSLLFRTIFMLVNEIQYGIPNGNLFAEGLSVAIVGLLNHRYGHQSYRGLSHSKYLSPAQQLKIREFIDGHLDMDLSIERLASEVNISPYHFARLFRETFGMPPHRYVIKVRIERAAHLLQSEQHRTITDIALETGFSSHAHFTSAFKRHMGRTPAFWRQI
jgi:AraC-like DNA-binding protein